MKQNKIRKESKAVILVKKLVEHVEKIIIKALIILMSILLISATIELGYQTFTRLFISDTFLINIEVLMDLFGVFLLVLIGIELLDTIKVYFKKNVVHVEVVILVAIIAIARKVIVLDFDKYDGLEVIGIGFVIIALATSYYLIKKAGGCQFYVKDREVTEIDPETGEAIKITEETVRMQDTNKQQNISTDYPKSKPPCGA